MKGPFYNQGIAIVGPFPPRPGGVSVQCESLARQLISAGARVTRVNTDIPLLRRRGKGGRLLLPFAQVPQVLRELHRTRRQWQVMHVHAASWWGFMPAVVGLVARRWQKRLVLTYHGGAAADFMQRWAWLATPVLKRYDAVLTLTATQARIFIGYGVAVEVVPNIVPVEDFIYRERGALEPKILWLRQLESRYRPADALAVLALVQQAYPAATLTMAGGGSLADELQAQAEDQHLPGVTFLGHLPPATIADTYNASDIFLNTSAIDNLPLTLIEAGASGLPIVSTDAGAISDLITHEENGLLSPVADVHGLADAIITLLEDPTLAQRLSVAAHNNAQRFSWQEVAPQLVCAYHAASSD
ncbi:MAG: glycosyltransferase family 4 protein [Chloroflexi bacterium]|nr:glycosyltransferase family 4 protein [Chloroflexota bacterium]